MGLTEKDKSDVGRLSKLVDQWSESILPTLTETDDSDDDDDDNKSNKMSPAPIKEWSEEYVKTWSLERRKRFDKLREHPDKVGGSIDDDLSYDDKVAKVIAVAERAYQLTRSLFLVIYI